MFKRTVLIVWLLICLCAPCLGQTAHAQETTPLVIVLTADGPVTPIMSEYFSRGIQIAERQGAAALIIQLNTPGGNIDTMNEMVQIIRASQVPIVVYVAPRGGMAASAGAIVTLAGHASAMAPETTIGAASPVDEEGQDLDVTMQAKLKNVMRATVRSLAAQRPPEAISLAEGMIENALAVSAQEALDVGLVDFIADSLPDLLQQLDGFKVTVASQAVVLDTDRAAVQQVDISWIEELLLVLTSPNIVFLLITIGVQAILIEISSPGGWAAGFIGVVLLALATYGLGVLPVNWFGIVFLVTAFVLFILDIKAPTHGALTIAGVSSLIVGALVLFNSPSTPSFQRVSIPLVIGSSLFTGAIFFTILMIALRAQRAPIRTGQESLIGRVGVAKNDIAPQGNIQVGGELWSAVLEAGQPPISARERVEVVSVDGLHLIVRKVA